MTDRALSPIDWRRAGRYESKKKKKGWKEGTKDDRQSGPPTDKTHLISGSRGREGCSWVWGNGNRRFRFVFSDALAHTQMYTHSSYPTKAC